MLTIEELSKSMHYIKSLKFIQKVKMCTSIKNEQPLLVSGVLLLNNFSVPIEMVDHVLCIFLTLYHSFTDCYKLKHVTEKMYDEEAIKYVSTKFNRLKKLASEPHPEQHALSFTIERLRKLPRFDLHDAHCQECIRASLILLNCLVSARHSGEGE